MNFIIIRKPEKINIQTDNGKQILKNIENYKNGYSKEKIHLVLRGSDYKNKKDR